MIGPKLVILILLPFMRIVFSSQIHQYTVGSDDLDFFELNENDPDFDMTFNEPFSEELSEDMAEEPDEASAKPSKMGELLKESVRRKKALTCVNCDSKQHGDKCLYGINLSYLGDCYNAIGQCYTVIIDGNVIRGCVGDELIPDHASARNYSDSIRLCNDGRLCNADQISDTCIECTGPECESPSLDMERVCSLESTSTGCYLKINSNNLHERGCLKNLPEEDKKKCQEPDSEYCQSCSKRNCNQKSNFTQVCHFCDGVVHKDCFREVSDVGTTMCIGYSSVCLTGIDEDGFTQRQCSQSDEEDSKRFPNGFETCYGDLCNRNVFPENRLECYRCRGGHLCDHPSVELKGEMCRKHPDECFVSGEEDGNMIRGCMSEPTRIHCETHEESCFKCNHTECNYLQPFQINNRIPVYQYAYPGENSSNGLKYSNLFVIFITSFVIISKMLA